MGDKRSIDCPLDRVADRGGVAVVAAIVAADDPGQAARGLRREIAGARRLCA